MNAVSEMAPTRVCVCTPVSQCLGVHGIVCESLSGCERAPCKPCMPVLQNEQYSQADPSGVMIIALIASGFHDFAQASGDQS